MSNHSGSYMLNEVLHLLDEKGVFSAIGLQSTQELVLEILRLSHNYDCNPGEILDNIAKRLSICLRCLTVSPELIDGVCEICRTKPN